MTAFATALQFVLVFCFSVAVEVEGSVVQSLTTRRKQLRVAGDLRVASERPHHELPVTTFNAVATKNLLPDSELKQGFLDSQVSRPEPASLEETLASHGYVPVKLRGESATAMHQAPCGVQPTVPPASPRKALAGVMVICIALLVMLGWLAEKVLSLYEMYSDACEKITDLDWSFGDFMQYHFGSWMAWASHPNATVVAVVATLIFLIGTLIYFSVVQGQNIWYAAWKTYIWMVSPDAGRGEQTLEGALVGGMLSIAGVFIFALVLALVQNAFDSYLTMLKSGSERVYEVGHVVVIGMTKDTIPLVNELCTAYAKDGGVAIVLLAGEVPVDDLKDLVSEAKYDLQGSRVIIRGGFAQYEDDLDFVSSAAAKSIIIVADQSKDKEVRDAFAMQALLVLMSKGWPANGTIVCECSLLKNRDTIEALGGDKMTTVMTDRWLAKLFVQVSEHEGIGSIVKQILSFDGSEMYVVSLPDRLVGTSLAEIATYYPKGVVLGFVPREKGCHVNFGHYEEHKLPPGHDLLLLADSDADAMMPKEPMLPKIQQVMGARTPIHTTPRREHVDDGEKILMVGWGKVTGPLMIELDERVPPNSTIVVVSPKPIPSREDILARTQRRWGHTIQNLKIEHVVGMLGSPTVWDRVPGTMDEFHRIFIIGDDSAPDARHADACTVAAILHVRHLLALTGTQRHIPIVPEISDPRTEHLCNICKVSNFIDSSGMQVQVLASVSFQPRLREIMKGLISVDGQISIYIAKLQHYMPVNMELPDELSFMDIQGIVCPTGHVLVGWGRPSKQLVVSDVLDDYLFRNSNVAELEWHMNPHDKITKLPWDKEKDRIVVLVDHHDRIVDNWQHAAHMMNAISMRTRCMNVKKEHDEHPEHLEGIEEFEDDMQSDTAEVVDMQHEMTEAEKNAVLA